MNYFNISPDQSNEIHYPTFWCYFDPDGNTTRMSNILPKDMEDSKERKIKSKDPRMIKKEKKITPVTIAPAKVSLKIINRRVRRKYRKWSRVQNTRKYCLKILEVIPKGEEKAYKFQEQQQEEAAEVECWEKEQSEERQRKLQEKYQRLKQDREQQQQQKQKQQRKKKQTQDDNDDDTVITETTQESSLNNEDLECTLIDEEDDTNNNNIVIIPTQLLSRMNDTTSKWKWKNKKKQHRQKERYSRKMKMNKKIASMIMNATNEYPTCEENVSKENET